jgi:hypothetical protein
MNLTYDYDIVICTTAVSRLKLHNITVPNYISFLTGFKCLWLVNIDQIHDENVLDTVQNFKNLVANVNNIDLYTTHSTTGGSRLHFYTAARNLINHASHIVPKYGYLWLEDDWLWDNSINLMQIINSIGTINSLDYIQLVNRPETCLSFNPGLFGTELFLKTLVKYIEDTESKFYNKNPERASTTDPYNNYNNLITLCSKCTKIKCFNDIGRDWQRSMKYNSMSRTFGDL